LQRPLIIELKYYQVPPRGTSDPLVNRSEQHLPLRGNDLTVAGDPRQHRAPCP